MKKIASCIAVSLLFAVAAFAEWEAVGPGVDYQQFREAKMDAHVTRVDLTNDDIVIAGTRETERGMRLSDFAKKNRAIAAINGDYFDEKMRPVGLAIGPCGVWEGSVDTKREGVIAIGRDRAAIYPQAEVMEKPEEWVTAAISGWPMIVRDCRALRELPGSDVFTLAPHPRTAVGLSKDGKTLYFVVADGRREGVPGLTLAELASFMVEELDVCSAMNVDGGGSSAMWVRDEIVNRPSDGNERRVAVHLAVLRVNDYTGCDLNKTNIAASPTRGSTPAAAVLPATSAAPTAVTPASRANGGGGTATSTARPPVAKPEPAPAPPLPPTTLPGYPAPVPPPRPPPD